MTLEITNTQCFTNKSTTMPGSVAVTFNDVLTVTVSIYSGKDGLAVLWPADKYEKDGQTKYKRKVMFHKEEDEKFSSIENEFNNQILDAWDAHTASAGSKAPSKQTTPTKDRAAAATQRSGGSGSAGTRRAVNF